MFAIGPWVKRGSSIPCLYGGGERWRYFFDGERCRQQEAKFVYEDVDG